ncbi:MAG TPA: PIN domain-containing protein [Chloroflexi bacterium]|nr:PIN domain-containing protein [Chloroflexota bacterium]
MGTNDGAHGASAPAPPEGGAAHRPHVVLDTNVFVAAGFNPHSNAARILERIRAGTWTMVWNRATRRETEAVLAQIPPLSVQDAAPAFRPEAEVVAETHPDRFAFVPDPGDRKFAALAAATGAVLVTNDDHLLSQRHRLAVEVLTPSEAMARYGQS